MNLTIEWNLKDRFVKTPGIETGRLEVIAYEPARRVLVVKHHGHRFWCARGRTKYAPTEYRVYRLREQVDAANNWWSASMLVHWDVRTRFEEPAAHAI